MLHIGLACNSEVQVMMDVVWDMIDARNVVVEKVLRNNETMSGAMRCTSGAAIFILPMRQY